MPAKGTKMSLESREKISKTHKRLGIKPPHRKFTIEQRKNLSEKNIGNKNALGTHHIKTKEHRLKLGEAEKGSKNWRWQNDLTTKNLKIRNSPAMKFYKKEVFNRDKSICQKTGQKGGKLVAHHIKNFSKFPELRFEVKNGITLSKEAHEEFHHIYGYYNNTLKQIEEFIGKKLSTS